MKKDPAGKPGAPAADRPGGTFPWNRPKEPEDDPLAHERVQAILQGSGYRLAQEDVAFLASADLRGVRLQIDYAKAQSQLERHGVEHTIVVLGSTRIPEPAAAQRALERARAAARACAASSDPDAATAAQRCARAVAVAERVQAKSRYYEVARELGARIAADVQRAGAAPLPGDGARLMVMTGGGPGIMEAANRGAFDRGAKSIGLNIALPHEQFPNPYVDPELCLRFHYFALRKLHFLLRARALVAFPGGYGTFDELFETLTLVQTRKIDPVPIVLVGRDYWRRAFDVDFLVDEGTILPEDRELFWYAESAQEVWDGILAWYEARGRPLLAHASASTP